jgi:tripartite-type tricarboxylate transporter receptor subunit TctC
MMKTKRCRMLIGLSFLLPSLFIGMSFFSEIHAATYPDRPITIVVPFPAGGLSDLGARIIGEAMEKHLKQPVIIMNKTGGMGSIGGYAVASAKPDGYTLGFFANMTNMPEVFSYFYQAPYSGEDLKAVSSIQTAVLGWTIKGDSPWNSIKDVVDFARKNPGMKVGHPGKGTVAFLSLASVARAEKVNLIDVPYQGDALIVPAVIGEHIPVGIVGFPAVRSLYEAKKVKVLAFCLEKRAEFAPEIPTVVDLGYKLSAFPYLGIFAPKGTPDEVVKRIDEVIHKISEEQDFRNRSNATGLQVIYENTATFEKAIIRAKEGLQAFFKEQGLVK